MVLLKDAFRCGGPSPKTTSLPLIVFLCSFHLFDTRYSDLLRRFKPESNQPHQSERVDETPTSMILRPCIPKIRWLSRWPWVVQMVDYTVSLPSFSSASSTCSTPASRQGKRDPLQTSAALSLIESRAVELSQARGKSPGLLGPRRYRQHGWPGAAGSWCSCCGCIHKAERRRYREGAACEHSFA